VPPEQPRSARLDVRQHDRGAGRDAGRVEGDGPVPRRARRLGQVDGPVPLGQGRRPPALPEHVVAVRSRSTASRARPDHRPRPCLSVVGGIQPDVLLICRERHRGRRLHRPAAVRLPRHRADALDRRRGRRGGTGRRGAAVLRPLRPQGRRDAIGRRGAAPWRAWIGRAGALGPWYNANEEEVPRRAAAVEPQGDLGQAAGPARAADADPAHRPRVDAGGCLGADPADETLEAASIWSITSGARPGGPRGAADAALRSSRSASYAASREHGPSTTRTVQVAILNNAVKYDRVKHTLERAARGRQRVGVRAGIDEQGRAPRPNLGRDRGSKADTRPEVCGRERGFADGFADGSVGLPLGVGARFVRFAGLRTG
jgi:hypothetical protein